MKTLQESIIGRKNSQASYISIPGVLNIEYKYANGLFLDEEKCDGWYILTDQGRWIMMLWSPKAKYYPFIFIDNIRKEFDYTWNLLRHDYKIKTPEEMCDLINTNLKWAEYVLHNSVTNCNVILPEKVKSLIDKYKLI